MRSAQDSANDETKSSAGDKHETGRAMAMLEVEMNSRQLREAESLQDIFRRIDFNRSSETIVPGSLVMTTQGVFLIAISAGTVRMEDQTCFLIAPDAPIGRLLMGKRAGDVFLFQDREFCILTIG